MRKAIALAAVLCVIILLDAPSVFAQLPSRPANDSSSTGRMQSTGTSQDEILFKLRESGMSREQVRQRLRQAGYDPNLADGYFDELNRPNSADGRTPLSGSRRSLAPPSRSLISGLRQIGVLTGEAASTEQPTVDSVPPPRRKLVQDTTPQVFGRDVFAATTQFEPVVSGPVDEDYRLGPGDELTLVVTGEIEFMYELTVSREGYLIIPDVGQVLVNGLTIAEAKRRLNDRLARVYSGVQMGTTQSDLSVGRVRSKVVYVIGEVEVPGAYQLTGTATVFTALYRAGGPALNGSFRRVEVRRGDRLLRTVDLYNYLLRGDKSGDVTLEAGDVVFVPIVGPQVTVVGSVRRKAIFELLNGESLTDVVGFAGGTVANAAVERIQIDRILPVGQRRPGQERVLVDVDLVNLVSGKPLAMEDGDRVRISKISELRRNRVLVSGDVQRPGEYEYRPGMTALDLINNAQGLLTTAFGPNAHVVRLNPVDSSKSLVRVVLDDPNAAAHAARVQLQDLDELVVFSRAKLVNARKIEIFGYVKNEGTYEYADGMTLEDLVLLAGGFAEGADDGVAEVARRVAATVGRDSLATVHRLQMDVGLSGSTKRSDHKPFVLAENDQVFVRRRAGYQPLSTVEVLGEVNYPGDYTVRARTERVSDLVNRAGGLTKEAYARGFSLLRNDKPVAVDLPKALRQPGGPDDIAIEPGDRIEVPRFDPTVLVTGAVAFEARVRYEDGLDVEDYLTRAGGVRDDGNEGKVSVRYQNGEIRSARRVLGVRQMPRVEPGSTIIVPERTTPRGFNLDQTVARAVTLLSGLATIILTVRALD